MEQVREVEERILICREAYDKLSRRFKAEMANNKKKEKKAHEFSFGELFSGAVKKAQLALGKIFRKPVGKKPQ